MSAPSRQDLIEVATWERYRAAILIHDIEHSHRTWLERQRTCHEWKAAYLGDEGEAT